MNKNTIKTDALAEVVVNAINGMPHNELKSEVTYHIEYVPGCDDEYVHQRKIYRQAREIFEALFSEIYERITGIKGEKVTNYMVDWTESVNRIYNMLDTGITVRGIYRVWDSTGVKKCISIVDNITQKANHIYTDYVTMDDINKWSEGVDICLVGDDIKKELGL